MESSSTGGHIIDPVTILAALGPLVVEGGKAAIQKWLAPENFKPTTIDDYVKLKQTDIDFFNAVNNAGGNNSSYPWVEAIVRLMRPSIAVGVIGTWAICKLSSASCGPEVDNFAAAIGFYLFGDRSLFYAKQKV